MAKKNPFAAVVAPLSHYLADTFVLYMKTLNFHWNMVGGQFFMYHKLLEQQYTDLHEALDEIAERIRMLGAKAPGTLKEILELATCKESANTLSQDQMVKELVRAHEEMMERSHEVIRLAQEVGDEGTADMVIDRLRVHDKQAWLLRSHYQK